MPRPARPATPTLQTGHSLYSALVGCWYNAGGATMVDAMAALDLPAAGGANTATGSFGEVGRCDANDEGFYAAAAAGHKVNEGTLAWYGVPTAAPGGTAAPIFGISRTVAGGGARFSFAFTRSGGAADNVLLYVTDGVGAYVVPNAGAGGFDWSASYNTDVTLIGTHDADGAQELFVNGVSRGTFVLSGPLGYGADARVGVGVFTTADAGTNPKTDMMLGLLLNRPMTAPEIAAFEADPWEILRPPKPPAAPTIVSKSVTHNELTVNYSAACSATGSFSATLNGTINPVVVGSVSAGDGTATHTYPITGKIYSDTFEDDITLDLGPNSVEATNGAGSTGNDAVTGAAVDNESEEFWTPRTPHVLRYKIVIGATESNVVSGIIGEGGIGRQRGRGRGRRTWF